MGRNPQPGPWSPAQGLDLLLLSQGTHASHSAGSQSKGKYQLCRLTINLSGSSKHRRSFKTESEYFWRLLLVAARWKCDSLANSTFLAWTLSEKATPKHGHHATFQPSTDERKEGFSPRTAVVFQHLKKKITSSVFSLRCKTGTGCPALVPWQETDSLSQFKHSHSFCSLIDFVLLDLT